jgi:hypothetical protein
MNPRFAVKSGGARLGLSVVKQAKPVQSPQWQNSARAVLALIKFFWRQIPVGAFPVSVEMHSAYHPQPTHSGYL